MLLKCSDQKYKQDMNYNTPEDGDKAIEMLLYWHKNLERKALIAHISWSWGRHEPEDDSSKDEDLEIENIGTNLDLNAV